MRLLLLITTGVLWLISPINRVEKEHTSPLPGAYAGTSEFVGADSVAAGYNEAVDVWFVFEDSVYRYGLDDTLPKPLPTDEVSFGYGPYTISDSTVSLRGGYVKMLRPAAVLYGDFRFSFEGDTLVLRGERLRQSDRPVRGEHLIRLVRLYEGEE